MRHTTTLDLTSRFANASMVIEASFPKPLSWQSS